VSGRVAQSYGGQKLKQYQVILNGLTPLLMHNDNLAFSEKIAKWRRDPANKEHSISGDDRTPPWTWVGYTYHDGHKLGVDADNIMTMLREGGAKVMTGKRQETYKKQTQYGIMCDQQQFELRIGDGSSVNVDDFGDLIGNLDFAEHIERAELLGFELLVKRAKIGQSKHVRVRPMFRQWSLQGSLTVIDEDLSGLTEPTLQTILNQSGALCGLCDWRPSSPKSGTFGKFAPILKRL
jgi:hypothetical protein